RFTRSVLKLDYRFANGIKFRSTSGFARQDLQERYDATAPGGVDRLFVQKNDTRMLAHETRLWVPLSGRFGWLTGLSLVDNRTRLTRSLGSPDGRSASPGVLNTITEVTVYGEASYRLRESLIASIGARYTHAWLGGSGQDVAEAFVRAEITASRTQGAFLPSASLLAEVGPATSLFIRYQEGFRPGGLAIQGNFVSRFEQDRAATMEFGLRHGRPKLDPFDLTLSLSHTKWSDIQADFIDQLGLPSTANIGDGRVWSASSVVGAYLAPELRLDAGVTYNKSRIDEPSLALLSRISHVPNIARFSGRLGLEYSARIARDLDLEMRAWASYIGKSRLGVGPELGELQGDYLDSGLVARIGRDRLGATISVTNLADVQGNRFALGTPFVVGRDQVTPLRPRTIRLGVDFSF
ncbi:MAG: TonB-dependent receptor, partial [Alphaproteobacteria bacterium]|nr:TonB-dependent receptor [Alphaproteobacteria bacterium]